MVSSHHREPTKSTKTIRLMHLKNLMFIGPCIIAIVEEWSTNWMSLAIFYFTYYALNMFRTLIYPSSGACNCVDELPHRSSCSHFVVCWSFCCGWYLVVFVLQVEAHFERIISEIKYSKWHQVGFSFLKHLKKLVHVLRIMYNAQTYFVFKLQTIWMLKRVVHVSSTSW